MSQENVEVVRQVLDRAFVRRDFEAALEFFDAEAVMDWSASRAPYSGIYRGHAQIRRSWEGWTDAWDEWHPHIKEAIEVDRETVVVVTRIRARGKGSGVPVKAEGASVWVVRGGKIIRAKLLQSKDEALAETAGLSEQDAHADSS